ncbi:MAG: hypothetical protein HYV77_03165 [Candidatus Wildermuthbacteria bacterium]|nr:hypothetical protein [Candidatus Wildermuthbacteria bacterium]
MATDIKHILKEHAYQNIPLTWQEAYDLGNLTLRGCDGDALAAIQSIGGMCALHNAATYDWKWNQQEAREHKHELAKNAAEQIAGICAAIFDHDIATSEFGFFSPRDVPFVMDNCGMGGDLIQTANVSTIAAFIAAAAGVPMCKHGSPANADRGKHGSSDFIKMCGINLFPSKEEVERCITETRFGYTEALDPRIKRIHLQTHEYAKLPHMNDIIGPITNPVNPRLMSRRVVGVNHLIRPGLIAEAYQILNAQGVTAVEHVLAIRGFATPASRSGMDEASICPGGTLVAALKDGVIEERMVYAEDFGLATVNVLAISPPRGMSKGDFSMKILRGEIGGPALQMVLANAALVLYVAGISTNLKECFQRAEAIHEKGLALKKMLQVRALIPA